MRHNMYANPGSRAKLATGQVALEKIGTRE
ncbi:MAG: hypothetical protein UX89_C0008G0017 [Parcubacteria group bacterium GW2011_GWA2_47_16]|nr:MAG: hypothetical protein UX89_C0008G0017 [Parcubacteria group bacterium GW2011_GWA2_47_16]